MKKIFLFCSISLMSFDGCESQFSGKEVIFEGEKIKGLCFVAPRSEIDTTVFEPVKAINSQWIAVIPYSFVRMDSARLMYSENTPPPPITEKRKGWHWWGETKIGVSETIKMAHKKGLKVMIKPHAWIRDEKISFTGDLDFETDEKWKSFEQDFRNYLLDYAKVGAETNAEMYCIATEFETFVEKRPQFWIETIKEIRKIYKGKLTYAENWDCFEKVPFWNELDFIGIDGYFPLSDEKSPSKESLRKGWKEHLKKIENIARKEQKAVLFTEFGYQSTDFSTHKPWESHSKNPDNDQLQADALQVVFEEVWNQKWFGGGFIWKWFPELSKNEQARDKYSPQNKVAESTITKFFGKN